jgi:hypothetical protein
MMLLHATLAVGTANDIWLAQCGALWVIMGAAVIARPMIRRGGYRLWYESTKLIDHGTLSPTPSEIHAEQENELDARCVQIIGPGLAILGTLLWAYGDAAAACLSRAAATLGLPN